MAHYRERVHNTDIKINFKHYEVYRDMPNYYHPIMRFKNTSKEPNIIDFEYRKFKYHIEVGIRAIITVMNKETGEVLKYSMKPLKPQHLMHQCVIQFSGNDYDNHGSWVDPSNRANRLKNSPPINYWEIKKMDDLKENNGKHF
jgi:hypothetical protein